MDRPDSATAPQQRLTSWLPLVLILALGALLRFMQTGLIRYAYDQSYPAYQALGLLDGGQWPLIGQPSSIFLDNPVLMIYIQAIPLALFRSPLAVQAFILILNTAAIWFVYRAAADVLGEWAGLIAAFLFAVNPWVIYFSRTTWVQSLVPFFMAVIAWGLWPTFVNDRPSPRRFLGGGMALTLLTQTYVQAWGVLPQIALLLFIFRRRVPRRPFLIALSVFLAATAFYVAGLATRAEVNTDKASNFLAGGWQGLSAIGLLHGIRQVNGIDFRPAVAPGDAAGGLWTILSTVAIALLTLALAMGFVLALAGLLRQGRERRLAVVLIIWFAVPVLLTSVEGAFEVHPHYLLLTLPAGHALAAWGIESLRRWRAVAAVAWALLLVGGLIFARDVYRANSAVAAAPVMPAYNGWALETGARLGEAIRAWTLAEPGPYPRRIVADGDKEVLSGLSATLVQPVGGVVYPDFVLLSPQEPLLYVFEGDSIIPHWLEPFMRAVGGLPLGATRFALAETAPEAMGELAAHVAYPVEWPSDAGLTLVGYSLSPSAEPAGALELITYWRVDGLHPDRGAWYVAPNYHVVDESGAIVANAGEHGQWAHRWELGDVYVERMTIPMPEGGGPFSLAIGLFDSVRGVAYTFFDENGPVERFVIPLQ
jgi:4-amino-4-deoxy-L-arabinose transferase-like glycosyltransferase